MMKFFKSGTRQMAALSLVLIASCGSDKRATLDSSLLDPPAAQGLDVQPADSATCAEGGIVVRAFVDANRDGLFTAGETVLNVSRVCNGATGAQGAGAGIEVQPASAAACPAGGQTLTTFVDRDNNGLRAAGETVTSVSTLCNGIAGASGAAGASARLTVTTASSAQCPAGGAVYTAYVEGATPTTTVVCSGQNGQNAAFQAGPVGDAVPGRAYSACHHDYLYIPSADPARSWLTFRHQRNGSADQGIGATGFQVWNVDISDFALVSEVGGVAYCSLHWDAPARRLSYTVVDATDGQQGRTGAIQFAP